MKIDLHSANEYFLSRLNSEEWFSNNSDKRNSAIMMAKENIFRLPFIGEKLSSSQEEPFPRNYNGNIVNLPDDIVKAVFEEALELIKGDEGGFAVDVPDTVQSFSLGSASVTFKSSDSCIKLSNRARMFLEGWIKKGFDVAPASFKEIY